MSSSNRKLVASIGLIALAALVWLLFRGNSSKVLNLDSKGTSIVAFGDSLVRGVGSSEGHDFVALLSASIGKPIINLGMPGDTTITALSRLDSVIAADPRVVIVLLGGNDALRKIPRSQTFSNLEQIVSRIQDAGSAVLVLGVRGGLLSDSYEDEFESLVRARRTAYVPDILDGIFGDPKLMSDAVHPNDTGYEMIAQKVLPVLQRMLDRGSR